MQLRNNAIERCFVYKISNDCTCACIKPSWTQEPFDYNESGSVKLVCQVKDGGVFDKSILVHYNGEDSPKTLKVRGVIIDIKKSGELRSPPEQ